MNPTSLTFLVVVALAVARVTRLVTRDYITEGVRRWVQRRSPEPVAYLVGCPWCASMWLAFPVSMIAVYFPTNKVVVGGLIALAATEVAGLVSSLLDQSEDYGVAEDQHDTEE